MASMELPAEEDEMKKSPEAVHKQSVSSIGIEVKEQPKILHPTLIRMLQCQLMMSILVTFLILPVGLTSTYLLVKAQKYLSWGKTNKGLKYLKASRVLSCGGLVFFMLAAIAVLAVFILLQLGTIPSSFLGSKTGITRKTTESLEDNDYTVNPLDAWKRLQEESETKIGDTSKEPRGRKNNLGLFEDFSGDHNQ